MLKGLLFPLLFAGASAQTDCSTLLITEIADPNSDYNARYVELFSFTGADLSYYALRRWTNGNDSPQSDKPLNTGDVTSVAAGGYFIVCNNKDTFDATYSATCDLDLGGGGPADSNGDDQIALVDTTTDTVIDLFGVPGEDGTGTGHEFEDGRAERASTVTCASPTWIEAEWNIDNDGGAGDGPVNAPDGFDPGSWIGDPNAGSADSPPPSPPITPPPPSPFLVYTSISTIQGGYDTATDCFSSLMAGTLVAVSGYVSALKYNGFWLSEHPAAAPYTGIWVYTDSADLSTVYIGMPTYVSGEAKEFFDLTEIEVLAANDQHGFSYSDSLGPADAIVPMVTTTGGIGVGCSESGEAHEGILVTVYNAQIMSEADRFGQITIDDGSGATELEDSLLDTDSHLEQVLNTTTLTGTVIYSITGIVSFSYGSYEIHPRDEADIVLEAPVCPDGCLPIGHTTRRERKLLFGAYPPVDPVDDPVSCPDGCTATP